MADVPAFAPLTARLVRRAPRPDWPPEPAIDPPRVRETGGWRGDLRLFALTWAGGFVFFLAFLA